MGTLNVFPRHGNANCLDDLQRLCTKLGVTGTAAFPFFVTTHLSSDNNRADALANSFRNDPNVSACGIAS